MNYWVLLYRFAWVMVLVLIAIGLLCIFVPKFESYQELQGQKNALTEENAKTEGRVKDLERYRQQFDADPEFVERVARQHGMAKPGETVYRVTN